MKNMIPIMVLAVLLVTPGALAAKGPTIVETALAVNQESGEFSILIQALQAEGDLLAKLSTGRGQYTVFAPTDAAFVALLEEKGLTAGELLGNKELLSAVLNYHVAPGARDAEDVTTSDRVRTLSKGFLFVNGAELTDANGRTSNIVGTDVFAGNGVIHVIDRVVLP